MKILIRLNSSALGDTIAWIQYTEEYRIKHELPHIFVNCNWSELFDYPLTIFNSQDSIESFDKIIDIDISIKRDGNLNYPAFVPLQKYASDKLGFRQFIERKPRMLVRNSYNPLVYRKCASIGIHSTAQAKYWNNPTGWQEVVDFLNSNDYVVYCLDRHRTFGNGELGIWNEIPESVIFKENIDIHEIISLLEVSDFFIGLGSGLSWLAWALDIPVIMISGFSDPITEFTTKMYRIHNKTVCNSCFNKSRFDASIWDWCPEIHEKKEKFECTKIIKSETIIERIIDCVSSELCLQYSSIKFPSLDIGNPAFEGDWQYHNVIIRGIDKNRFRSEGGSIIFKVYDITTNLIWHESEIPEPNINFWWAIGQAYGDFPLRFITEGIRIEIWESGNKIAERNIYKQYSHRYVSHKSIISLGGDKIILDYPSSGLLLQRIQHEIDDTLLTSRRWIDKNSGCTNYLPMNDDIIVDFTAGNGISSIWFDKFNPSRVFLYENDKDMNKLLNNNINFFDNKYEIIDNIDYLLELEKINYISCSNSDILDDEYHMEIFNKLLEKSETIYIKSKYGYENFNLPFTCYWNKEIKMGSEPIYIMGGCR